MGCIDGAEHCGDRPAEHLWAQDAVGRSMSARHARHARRARAAAESYKLMGNLHFEN